MSIKEIIVHSLSKRYRPLLDGVDLIETTADNLIQEHKGEPHLTQRTVRKMADHAMMVMKRAVNVGLYEKVAS